MGCSSSFSRVEVHNRAAVFKDNFFIFPWPHSCEIPYVHIFVWYPYGQKCKTGPPRNAPAILVAYSPLLTPLSPFKLYPTKTKSLHRITRYRGFCLIWRTCCKEDCLLNFCYGNLSPYRFSRIRQKFFHPHHKRFSPYSFDFCLR